MKRKQVTAACLMAATMLFSGCTPNISEYAARAQQAGKSFWEGETTDAMAQDSDAAATADDETLSLIHISEPTRLGMISYAVFCLKKKKP